jgi:GNAT superfamily N-acetyltransferase
MTSTRLPLQSSSHRSATAEATRRKWDSAVVGVVVCKCARLMQPACDITRRQPTRSTSMRIGRFCIWRRPTAIAWATRLPCCTRAATTRFLSVLATPSSTRAVLPQSRGSGLGTALLNAVDAALADRAITNLTVAVMPQNEPAIRLYRRRGLIPGELIMYRIGPQADPGAR